ncbi:MAG TPA: fused MFS/spermidine synthase [Candidatus Limnocylindrales bacterium]|nr:fused MFS/spermidine synthase [Candidatus Limnocylindrales bacterium]
MNPVHRHAALAVAIGAAVFLAGALLFVVQPLSARALLPAFGGASSVWATALVFYQVALLLGYALAHATARFLAPTGQVLVQLAIAGAPLLWLPLRPVGAAAPGDTPALDVALRLFAVVGPLPIALATAGPTLQRWFAGSGHPQGSDPYAFYAAGNAGSLCGLLAYPFVVEPLAGLSTQGLAWSIGYAAFVGLTVVTAALARPGTAIGAPAERPRIGRPRASLPVPLTALRWMLLAAVPAALAIAVTTAITLDLAASPVLWDLPLALYLLSWVVAFAPGAADRAARLAGAAVPVAVVLLALVLVGAIARPLWLVLGIHLGALFVLATALHARLATERPPPERLTGYYLVIAAGGALGGIAAALVAPLVFDGLVELPLAAAAAAALRITGTRARPYLLVASTAAPLGLLVVALDTGPEPGALLAALCLSLAMLLAHHRSAFAAAAAGLLLVGQVGLPPARLTERSFYGLYRVVDDAAGRRALVSGSTVQGIARLGPGEICVPMGYYHRHGPIGDLLSALQAERLALRIDVIGLGIGGMTALGRATDSFTFVEIDPLVVAIARDARHFRELQACPAQSRVLVGDGRLVLAAQPPGAADLVVLDAFSSNAVPVHLLTREALATYRARLAPGGLVAANISNRYVQLEPVLAAAGRDLGLGALARDDPTDPARAGDEDGSHWLVLGEEAALDRLRSDSRWHSPASEGRRPWTDDHIDLISAIDWGR